MNAQSLHQTLRHRVRDVDPLLVDAAMAVALAALVCLQIYWVTHLHPAGGLPLPPGARAMRLRVAVDMGVWPYLMASCAFLPLAFRRAVPWLALLLTGMAAITYAIQPMPPAFTTLGPMIAMYSLAAYARRRHMGLIALLVAGCVVAVPVFAYSAGVRWVAETVGAFTLLTAAALLGDTARNRREYIAEVEKRALEAERTREEEALRRAEEERLRIAREVHDIVAHSLSIVTVQAAAAEAVFDKDPEQARESIRTIRATGREALGELRSMLDVLRTGDSDAPLAPSTDLTHLEQLAGPVREAGIEVEVESEGDIALVPAFASVSGYRIVQEALTNVVRHSQATRARVTARVYGRELIVVVSDNGRGADARDIEIGGHGLRGMRERVEALGGTFEARAQEGGGFRITATIPLPRSGS